MLYILDVPPVAYWIFHGRGKCKVDISHCHGKCKHENAWRLFLHGYWWSSPWECTRLGSCFHIFETSPETTKAILASSLLDVWSGLANLFDRKTAVVLLGGKLLGWCRVSWSSWPSSGSCLGRLEVYQTGLRDTHRDIQIADMSWRQQAR